MQKEDYERVAYALFALILIAIGAYFGILLNNTNTQHETPARKNFTFNLIIGYNNHNGTYVVHVQNESLFYSMNKTLNLTYKMYGKLGAFIECINGVCQGNGRYWKYYINGNYAQVGASSYYPKINDNITWILK